MAELLRRDGVTIHYDTYGTVSHLTPLLLTHGYSSSSTMWEANLEAIGAERLLVTWDIRGHGRSGSPADPSLYSESACVADMAKVLDACGIERAFIGGLSLGGYLSLAFYLTHAARVAGLLLFDTGPGFKKDEGRKRWNAWAEERAVAFQRDGLGALFDSPEVGPGPHDPAGLALAACGILTQRDARVIESLPGIGVPTLVIVGEHDRLFLAAADYMARKIPRATKTILAGAGHAFNMDQASAFNSAVIEFLDREDAARP